MISIQVPHFMNHHMSAYNPMSHPAYLNGMAAMQKPMQQHHDNRLKPSSPGAKRRPSRAGTRSVATLTTAQLERKRANDREAQRAIRQRTKDHIDSLERRIAELTSTNDAAARLSQALQRNEELEQENKILRSRLNQAVTAMADGTPISPDMLTGPTSPSRKLRITTRSSSVPTVPRSIPNSVMTPTGLSQHQEQWNVPYASPVSTANERSPSLADVSPVSNNMRWGQHPQPSPVLSDPGHSVDHNNGQQNCGPQQSPVGYSYMIDNQGRALSYSPAAESHMMHHHHQFSSSTAPDSVGSFAPQHSGNPMSGTLPSPAYSQYPATPQSFMATSPHEAEPKFQMMGQQSPVEAQPIMYSMPTTIKDD